MFASLACLTCYIGVTLIITILPLLLFRRRILSLERAKRIGLCLLISALPVGLWVLHNFLVPGRLPERRRPSSHSLSEILDKFSSDLAGWVFLYLPSGDVRAAAVLTLMFLLALTISVGCSFVRLHRKDGGHGWGPFYLFGGFALVYLISLTASQSQTQILPLGERHLSPLYIPILFAAVFALDKLLNYEQGGKLMGTVGGLPAIRTFIPGGLFAVPIALALFLWLSCNAALNVREIRRVKASAWD